jgi:wyosine [tRNA(Phe)-imidazoG37] synthetase (radical SAM superfamily)
MAKKNNIDEKLVKWNEIFNELALDARDLIKDIKDMINYIAFSGDGEPTARMEGG